MGVHLPTIRCRPFSHIQTPCSTRLFISFTQYSSLKWNQTVPYHFGPSLSPLIPLSDNHAEQAASASVPRTTLESLDTQPTSPENDFDGFDGSDDELSELLDIWFDGRVRYRETIKAHVDTIRDLWDRRFLDTLEREGARWWRAV